jgi:NAD+ kinase
MNKKLHFIAAETEAAQDALDGLIKHYGQSSIDDCDIIVPLGGDGFLLESLHNHYDKGKAFYGVNKGSEGFLLNQSISERLSERIPKSHAITLNALSMTTTTTDGQTHETFAFNECALFRQTRQAANLKIEIDGKVRIEKLVSDGVLVCTPAGSTAYNLSAHGPIIPLNADLLALTPISPHRPRRWTGALLPNATKITIHVLDSKKRPMSATGDSSEFRNVEKVTIHQNSNIKAKLLFDPDHALEERIIREQFMG